MRKKKLLKSLQYSNESGSGVNANVDVMLCSRSAARYYIQLVTTFISFSWPIAHVYIHLKSECLLSLLSAIWTVTWPFHQIIGKLFPCKQPSIDPDLPPPPHCDHSDHLPCDPQQPHDHLSWRQPTALNMHRTLNSSHPLRYSPFNAKTVFNQSLLVRMRLVFRIVSALA